MTLGVKPKPKLTGAQRRKIAREKERAAITAGAKPAKLGEYIERDPEQKHNPRDQWSHDRWRLEMRLVYLEMRHKKILISDGTSLIWAADVNARLAKMAEELDQLKAMNDRLTAIHEQSGNLGLTFDRGDAIDVSQVARGDQNAIDGDSREATP